MRDRKTIRWLAAILAALVLLVVAGHLWLERHFDTRHVQERLAATVARQSDSLYRIRIGSSHFSLFGKSYTLRDLALYPDTAAIARRGRERPVPGTRFFITAASFRVSGLNLRRFFRNQLVASSASMDSLHVEVLVDRTLPRSPEHPVRLPHQVLQAAGVVSIEHFNLEHSGIRFAERAADGTRFGVLHFDSLAVAGTNLSNDSARMSAASPCRFAVHGFLEGAGPTAIQFEYDLASPRLNLLYHGSVSRFGGRALNQMLVDYAGFRIRHGQLDSLWFDVATRDDLATGRLQLRYHDLEIETLDKVSGDRSLGDVLRTFLFNHLKLHSGNPSGDKAPRVAALWHRRLPEDGFFRTFWQTLRAGIFETLGIADSPRRSAS